MIHDKRISLFILIISLLLGACSSAPEGTDVQTTTTADTEATPTTPAPPVETPPTTTGPTTAEPVLDLGITIDQSTPLSGGGDRPLLSWGAADGASEYFVVVYAEDGSSYWGAVTPETSIYVGGAAQISSDIQGPRISTGYTWVVFANDAEGNPIASSPRREISP